MSDTPIAPPVYFSNPSSGGGAAPTVPTNNGGIVEPAGVTVEGGDVVGSIMDLSLVDLVQMLIVYAFIIAAALSAIFIFVGGVSFILSGGNDEKIKAAVNTIRYSIIGLVVTILSFTFVTIIGRMFGLDFMSYISYSDIQARISQLVSTAQGR